MLIFIASDSSRVALLQAKTLFKSQAAGVFFDEMPMRFYGGTPLAYACCFDLRESAEKMLRTGFVSLNDRSDACCITGFLPVHAVCANGLMETYDWMTTELPEELRADVKERSCVGRQVSLNARSLAIIRKPLPQSGAPLPSDQKAAIDRLKLHMTTTDDDDGQFSVFTRRCFFFIALKK